MKKPHGKSISITVILLALSLVLSVQPALAASEAPAPAGYTDIPEDAAWVPAVQLLTQLGVFQGNSNGQFLPDGKVTREQFAKMAVVIANLATADNTGRNATRFADVSASRWSSGYIRTAAANGMMVGYADGRFHPDDTVSWGQALAVCLRLAGIDHHLVGGKLA